MGNGDEMLNRILETAVRDERIRAVTMEGSRANRNATHDRYCDFDICYVVTDIREFTRDKNWIACFGDILIVQYPMDWYEHPYDYEGHENFAYLIQFKDGRRIDLTLIDIQNIAKKAQEREPSRILLNKDNLPQLHNVDDDSAFFIRKPSAMEFYNTCNEFRWLSLYVSKGLCREEFYYAKYAYDVLMMEMFLKMLNWKIGLANDFRVTTGAHGKYLKRFLSAEEMERFHGIFPDGSYEEIWRKLYVFYDYFAELAGEVGGALGYEVDGKETREVRDFLERRQAQSLN